MDQLLRAVEASVMIGGNIGDEIRRVILSYGLVGNLDGSHDREFTRSLLEPSVSFENPNQRVA